MKKISDTCKELQIDSVFPIEVKDCNGNEIYHEDSSGGDDFWVRREFDPNGNLTSHEDSSGGFWRSPSSKDLDDDDVIDV